MTALPLMWFAIAARRLPYTVMGFLQFSSPTIVFVLGLTSNPEGAQVQHARNGDRVSAARDYGAAAKCLDHCRPEHDAVRHRVRRDMNERVNDGCRGLIGSVTVEEDGPGQVVFAAAHQDC